MKGWVLGWVCERNTIDAVAEFVDYMETNMSGGGICTQGWQVTDGDTDGHPDTFLQVTPGNQVCWDIHVKDNISVPATEYPQVFTATIDVWGDGVTQVDDRTVYFLVPPIIEGPGIPQ